MYRGNAELISWNTDASHDRPKALADARLGEQIAGADEPDTRYFRVRPLADIVKVFLG